MSHNLKHYDLLNLMQTQNYLQSEITFIEQCTLFIINLLIKSCFDCDLDGNTGNCLPCVTNRGLDHMTFQNWLILDMDLLHGFEHDLYLSWSVQGTQAALLGYDGEQFGGLWVARVAVFQFKP